MSFCFQVRRTCWVLLILGSLTVLIYNTTQQVIEFFEYHHLTKYDVNFVSELSNVAYSYPSWDISMKLKEVKAFLIDFSLGNVILRLPEMSLRKAATSCKMIWEFCKLQPDCSWCRKKYESVAVAVVDGRFIDTQIIFYRLSSCDDMQC